MTRSMRFGPIPTPVAAFAATVLDAVNALQPDVLLRERDLDLLAQDLRIEEVLHTDPEPRRFVRVARADPPSCRPDLQLSEPPFRRLVDCDMPRHNQVR